MGKRLIRLTSRFFLALVLLVGFLSHAKAGSSIDSEAADELARRRLKIADFNKRLKEQEEWERQKNRTAITRTREREREDQERERIRERFIQVRVLKDFEKIEREDRLNELEIEKRAKARDKIRAAFVQRRDQIEAILSRGPQLDQDIEMGIEDRDNNRSKRNVQRGEEKNSGLKTGE